MRERETDRQTERDRERYRERQTDSQTDRQTEKEREQTTHTVCTMCNQLTRQTLHHRGEQHGQSTASRAGHQLCPLQR